MNDVFSSPLDDNSPCRLRDWQRRIIVFYAGAAAEGTYKGAAADLRSILRYSRLAREGPEETAYLRYLRLKAKNLVRERRYRAAIGALAAALLEHRELTGRKASRIIGHAIYEHVFPAPSRKRVPIRLRSARGDLRGRL